MSKSSKLRALLVDLLQEHLVDNALPTSARFLYYELVQREHLSKEKKGARRPDQDMHDALTVIRENGQVPWGWIVDETRSLDDSPATATSTRARWRACHTSGSTVGVVEHRWC